MKARVLYRTHYQVEEPAYMTILVTICTSPLQGGYAEEIAQRLAREISSRGRGFNVAAAAYAVDLARGLGLLNENNTWTDKAQLLALHGAMGRAGTATELELDAPKRLTYFRIFLEADGAALLHIARTALPGDSLPRNHDWNGFAGAMFREIFSDYLGVTADISDRLALRKEIDRLGSPFTGKTGWHKSYIHLQTMFRLGLLHRRDLRNREYVAVDSMRVMLSDLVRLVPSVVALEEIIQQGRWAEIAASVFQLGAAPAISTDRVLQLAAVTYRSILATGVPLCPLSALVDAIQIHLMASGCHALTAKDILNTISGLQKRRPRDVRFHVDRRGRVAFMKMSDELARQLVESDPGEQ
jgi:hypothetical protein